jgi:large subunit ribosomal protein L22
MATKLSADGRPEVRAQARWLRIPPRKARLTVEHIRGRTVPEARTVLAFTERAAAREVEKVLRSAVANAEANHNLVGDDLIISHVVVDEGPTIKRWRARARGRAARIEKRTCHITLTLTTLEAPEERPKRSRLPRKSREAEPQAAGAAEEKASARREAKVEAAQAADVEAGGPTAEEAEGAASEEKPKRTRRKKKETND